MDRRIETLLRDVLAPTARNRTTLIAFFKKTKNLWENRDEPL
jgi:hypothetical protein